MPKNSRKISLLLDLSTSSIIITIFSDVLLTNSVICLDRVLKELALLSSSINLSLYNPLIYHIIYEGNYQTVNPAITCEIF